ncbi:photosystem I subunit O-like [Populus nigra]|uniref:photosystem I subunit O-like n=1 Tax=Populus nigra TaxID=3691 RepID=UPI002B274E18|nr:photosystem I subunit O-like [Populus nigra]
MKEEEEEEFCGYVSSLMYPQKSLLNQVFGTFASSSAVTGLGSSSLSSPSRASSIFVKSPVAARSPLRLAGTHGGKFMCFERDWLRKDLNVIGFGLIGWPAPSSIPAIGGKSLSGLFFESIGTELAHFPTPPPLTSQFWLWLVTWHLGLFICLTFGQIGFKGRTDEYF